MALTPVVRRSATDEVFEQILSDVVAGELTAGESLPSERRLAELLGVSRPVVREALQRMAQTGLVEVRQGGSTTVRNFGRFAGLDLLPRLLVRNGELDLAVARSILEARLSVGPDLAALAASRGSDDLGDTLGQVVDKLAEATDPVAMQLHVLTFWDRVVDAADSVVFRLMFNSLRAAYEPALEALSVILGADVTRVDAYRAVVADIAARDATAARRSAIALLEPTTSTLLRAIRELENPNDPG
jgi:GntR family transcriptional regulator, transcriptional repressor for pyruvate dehydrogenase complex